MKRLLPLLLAALTSGCHDAPSAPDCRIEGETSNLNSNAGCVIMQQGHLLVLKHRFGGKLGIPGGTAREGESAQCTAHRETWEETGLDVRVGPLLGRMRYGFTLYQCYPGRVLDVEQELELPWHALSEVTGAFWIAPQEIPHDAWRYDEQVKLFLDLVARANPAPKPAGSAAPVQ